MPQSLSREKPLDGKWIVVTRPLHQADQVRKKLELAGANVISFPLLRVEPPKNPGQSKEQLNCIQQYDLLIFISPNAVSQCFKWINPSVLKNTSIAAVGKKTAATLEHHEIIPNIFPEKLFNSGALLAMPEMQKLEADNGRKYNKIAIIKGDGGRKLLRETLKQRGADVDYINVYQRSCPQENTEVLKQHWKHGELDIIMLTSGNSVSNLFSLVKDEDWINNITLLLGSMRMKKYIPKTYSGELVVADDPSDETLYKKIIGTFVQEK